MADMATAGLGLLGDIANLGYSIYSDRQEEKKRREKEKKLQAATTEAQSQYDQMINMLNQYRAGQTPLSDPSMKVDLRKTISEFDPSKFDYDFGEFKFDKSLEDYRTPYYDQIIKGVADQLQHTAAGAGIGRGTGAATSIATGVAQKEDELNKTAYEMYSGDRSQAYREYADFISNMQNKYRNLADLTSTKVNLMTGAIQSDEEKESDYMSDLLNLMGQKTQVGISGNIAAFS